MFFITDQVQKGNISIKYCPTDDMTGEYMTKPLHGEKYASFRQDVMNLATKSVVVTCVVTKRTAASKTNNSGCKKCKRGKSPVVDGKVFDAFAEGSQIAQTTARIEASQRIYGSIGGDKVGNGRERKDYFAHTMELLQRYEQLKNEHGWEDDQIVN
jgi:hypothetical protein